MESPAWRYGAPIALLGLMAMLMTGSLWGESAIIDELAHIPAGYSYLSLGDARLNPEHPPLIKDLAAVPLLFGSFRFPTDTKSWRDDVNGQWEQGAVFLYGAGNDPDAILHRARIPMVALTILLGFLFWSWARRHFGWRVAALALFFFALSPTFIAHGRYVTTDIAASFAFFIGITAFLRFLRAPTGPNTILAGLAFGTAELLKFSLILLLPIYAVLLVVWVLAADCDGMRERVRLAMRLAAKTILVALVGVALIYIVYLYHVWNYPADRQYRDSKFILQSFRFRSWVALDLWLVRSGWLRPLGHYLLGLFMVLQRAAGGNTQYFIGTVSAAGSRLYFPILYLLKEPLPFHILSAVALAFAIARVGSGRKSLGALRHWIREHFAQFAAMSFIAIYWLSSLSSTLNIGVRHVLPTFPFIYLLVANEAVGWLRSWPTREVSSWGGALGRMYDIYIGSLARYGLATVLIVWQLASVVFAYPFYLSYFNGLAGGTSQGYRVATDSNYDWGQDLKRLAAAVRARRIPELRIDYFGGGSPAHEFGATAIPWNSAKGYPPGGGWYAVSATFLMGAYGKPVDNFQRRPEDSYDWLKPYQPVGRGGTSIFVFRLPP